MIPRPTDYRNAVGALFEATCAIVCTIVVLTECCQLSREAVQAATAKDTDAVQHHQDFITRRGYEFFEGVTFRVSNT